jgi:hypothetical protein
LAFEWKSFFSFCERRLTTLIFFSLYGI